MPNLQKNGKKSGNSSYLVLPLKASKMSICGPISAHLWSNIAHRRFVYVAAGVFTISVSLSLSPLDLCQRCTHPGILRARPAREYTASASKTTQRVYRPTRKLGYVSVRGTQYRLSHATLVSLVLDPK